MSKTQTHPKTHPNPNAHPQKDYSKHEMYGQLSTKNVRDDYDLAFGALACDIEKKKIRLVSAQSFVNHFLCVDMLADRNREGEMSTTHSAGVISSDQTAHMSLFIFYLLPPARSGR